MSPIRRPRIWRGVGVNAVRRVGSLHNFLRRIILGCCVLAGVFSPIAFARAAVPPAGYEILSRSTSEYIARNTRVTIGSNVVRTAVGPFYRISLTPLGTVPNPAFSLEGFGGDSLYCRFELRNAGNIADSVEVTSALLPPSTIGLSAVRFFHDSNGNSAFDPGEDDRSFLNLAPDESAELSTLMVLLAGAGGGESYVGIAATVGDGTLEDSEESVIRATTRLAAPAADLHVGPADNARALPGGEGGPDDVTRESVGFTAGMVVFANDILNDGPAPDVVRIEPADSTGWPPGLEVALEDSTGRALERAPDDPDAALVGPIDSGETRRVRVRVTSEYGTFYPLTDDSLSIRLRVRSLADSTVTNDTTDRVILARDFNADAAISLQQTFKENVASYGDVVTLVISVANVTDSVRVDDVVVRETPPAVLDFAGGGGFVAENGSIAWNVGSLGPGESRETAIKLAVNSRLSKGWTQMTGSAAGAALGRSVAAGPVVNALRIENDVFADEGVVLGEVFIDENENAKRDDGERGIANAGVFLESGEYALTDTTGRFSIPRAFSGWRVVRIDEATLPIDRVDKSRIPTQTNAFFGTERLVHLVPSGHAVVSFALPPLRMSPAKVTRQMFCGQTRAVQANRRAAYRWPSIPSSFFETGKAYLKTGTLERLDPIQDFLGANPGWIVVLEGHTDSIPIHTDAFPSNHELSLGRANAVMNYLTARGTAPERIVVRGYGESRPVATNATADGRAKNRRVDVTFVPPGASVDEETEVGRIEMDLEDVKSVVDTVGVRLVWEFSTDSPLPEELSLSVRMPPEFSNARVSVASGDAEVPAEDGRYRVEEFVRSRGVRCEVSFDVAATDTHLVREVRAVIESARGAVEAPALPETRYSSISAWEEDEPAGGYSTARADAAVPSARAQANADTSGAFGVIEPADRSVVTRRDRIEVAARVPLGSRYELTVGGAPVSEKQIGKKEIRLDRRTEEITWYGVRIASGWNAIRLRVTPADGSAAFVDSALVALAGRPTSIALSPERVILPADGHTGAAIEVELLDELGFPTVNGLIATVVEGDTLVANSDENAEQTGLQVAGRDGIFTLLVRPSAVTGRGEIVVESHGLRAAAVVAYVPPERRMLLTGVIEGRLGAHNTWGDGDPAGIDDYDDGFRAEGESRFFLQGTAFAGINLTARVDTKKRYDDPLLKTYNPETQYTVYGDASSLHYAAPAQGGNYVALEKGQSYLRYGDFRSPLTEGEFLKYKTNATGVNAAFVSGKNGVAGFVTRTDYFTARDEIPGDGTSGYYYLSRAPVVENSVGIVIETRDRYQPEKLIEARPLVEHRDFTVSYFNGAVLFKEPIPAFTASLDPVTIVAVYESESPGEGDYLYGVRADAAGGRGARFGVSALAKDADAAYAVYGADAGVSFGGWDLAGEIAQSDDDIVGKGRAYKLEFGTNRHRGEHSLYVRKVDGNYLNPSFSGSAHELYSTKAGFDSRLDLSRGFILDTHGYRHKFANTGDETGNVDAVARYENPVFTLGGGVRAASEERSGEDRDAVLSIVEGGARAGSRAEIQTRWEMNHGDEAVSEYPDRLRSSLSVSFLDRYKIIGTHEYLSAHDRPATHQLIAGVEARAGRYSTVYSKYSMNRTAADQRLGTILGLKQVVPISEAFQGTLDVEGFRSFSSRLEEEYVAVRGGLRRLERGESLIEGQYEYRWQRAAERHLLRLNAVRELNDGLAVLFKDALSIGTADGREGSLTMDGRIAAAWRPLAVPAQTLFLFKTLYDRYSPVDPQAIVWTSVLSTDASYTFRMAHELRLKLAYKWVENYSLGVSENGRNYLVLSQYVYRFARNWDVDLWGRFMGRAGEGTRQTGAGLEIGRILFDRVRVAAGYSINGFEDRDLAENEAWDSGFGLRVQLILSDWMFSGYEF